MTETAHESDAIKRKWNAAARHKLDEKYFGDPDSEAFPVQDQEDLDNANSDLNRISDKAKRKKIRGRLRRIGKELGLTIPDGLKEDGKSIDMEDFDFDEAVAVQGGAVKALAGGKIGGDLVVFGTADTTDLEGDFFTDETDYGPHTKSLTFYDHGQDEQLRRTVLDPEATIKKTKAGIWFEAQLNLADSYQKMIYKLAKEGKLGLSSGTAPHLVEREAKTNSRGEKVNWVKTWYLGLDASLTPVPAEPRTMKVLTVKSLQLPSFKQISDGLDVGDIDEIKSVGPSHDDRRRLIGKALTQKLREEGHPRPWSAWVTDTFDKSFVHSVSDPDPASPDTYGGVDNLYERSYKMDGLSCKVGDAKRVERVTGYKPIDVAATDNDGDEGGAGGSATKTISEALKSLMLEKFQVHSDSVLTAVKGYAARVQDYARLREEQGRRLSPERADEFKAAREEFKTALALIDEALDIAPVDRDLMELRKDAMTLDPAFFAGA